MSATMHLTREQLQDIIEALVGTTGSIEDHLPEDRDVSDLSMEDHQEIDSQIFNCCQCNWWVPVDEMAEDQDGEQKCSDCAEDQV